MDEEIGEVALVVIDGTTRWVETSESTSDSAQERPDQN